MRAAVALLAGALLAAAPATAADFYVITPGDLLQITVHQQADLSGEVRVGEDGTVSLSLVGVLLASGKTIEAFTRELAERYGEFLVTPQVAVFVKEYHDREVAVLGEVARPGLFRFKARATLLEAISQAGGLTPESGEAVTVMCRAPDRGQAGTETVVVAVRELFSTEGGERANIELHDGDSVHVQKRSPSLGISVLGAVAQPGLYRFKDKATLLEAISQAGGLTPESGETVTVLRRASGGASGGTAPVVVGTRDLFSPQSGADANVELRDGDTVHVPPTSAGVGIVVLGEVARPGLYRVKDRVSLLEVISLAGGLTQESGDRVIVLRPAAGDGGGVRDTEAILVDTEELFSPAGMQGANVELRAGDTVHVPRAEHFFVFGEVARPGSFKLEKGAAITVLKAIGLAGGFTDKAARRGIRITREAGGVKSEIKATLDTEVLSRDIIIVPESFF